MKIKSANGVSGMLLNPYHKEGKWVFRVYGTDGTFVDYDLLHSDLSITINDADASFYQDDDGAALDHSPSTLGLN